MSAFLPSHPYRNPHNTPPAHRHHNTRQNIKGTHRNRAGEMVDLSDFASLIDTVVPNLLPKKLPHKMSSFSPKPNSFLMTLNKGELG